MVKDGRHWEFQPIDTTRFKWVTLTDGIGQTIIGFTASDNELKLFYKRLKKEYST